MTYEFRNSPSMHLLEASSGIERHTLEGISCAQFADLDNDGLTDLWGELGHELRAFRGEAPEAWRALGEFDPAGAANVKTVIAGKSSVDLDGDGIGDALVKGVEAPGTWRHETTGSHTALARSGRDGHVIWKTGVDPSESWFDSGAGECYELSAFPLPHGDFDGDGTPDVIVSERVTRGQTQARPPIQLFSGRTGARLWAAGRLPLGFAAPGNVENIWLDARAVEVNRARISSCAAIARPRSLCRRRAKRSQAASRVWRGSRGGMGAYCGIRQLKKP